MSRYIKLTNQLINTNHIAVIKQFPKYYEIHMTTNYLDIHSSINSGWMQSERSTLTFYKDEHAEDYKNINKWYNNIRSWDNINF